MNNGQTKTWYTVKELEAARQYWSLLKNEDLQSLYQEAINNPLRGYNGYTLEEYIIISARRSMQEIGMNS